MTKAVKQVTPHSTTTLEERTITRQYGDVTIRYTVKANVRDGEIVGIPITEMTRAENEHALAFAYVGVMNAKIFRFLRLTLGLKAQDLATLLDVSPESISRWENDKLPVPHLVRVVVCELVIQKLTGKGGFVNRLERPVDTAPTELDSSAILEAHTKLNAAE